MSDSLVLPCLSGMTTTYHFLPADFARMEAMIDELVGLIRSIGQEMGLSCQEGAETFHDNFAYEDGERLQRMWGQRLRDLLSIRNNARVVQEPGREGIVAIGRTVTVRDMDTDEARTFTIGSYMVFEGQHTVSYNAPLVRFLIGAAEGEVREGMVHGQPRIFEVVSVR